MRRIARASAGTVWRAYALSTESRTTMGDEEYVRASTRCGELRGTVERSTEGYRYCAFKGVPYAVPPVGKLRFRDPLPAEPWQGTKDATKFGQCCAQFNMERAAVLGSDDCLYLNIYVKCIKPKSRLPVMVWIHGGAFSFGSGDDLLYGPDYLLRKDIVLVTFNYRVGALGFLNFEHREAPGNQGLKDQVMALRWVQENIENFGGDRENVTIFGESAGGASVHYLTISELAKGLFHKAIIQSGVACLSWACNAGKEKAYRLCRILGNDSNDPKKLIEFLQTVDVTKILNAQRQVLTHPEKIKGEMAFGPGVDSESSEPFLSVHPNQTLEQGIHVPLIIGHNLCEGIFGLPLFNEKSIALLNSNFEVIMNPSLADLLQRVKISLSELRRLYYGDERLSRDNSEKFVALWSDLHFIDGIHRLWSSQAKLSSKPTYAYRFTYDGQISLTKMFANTTMPGSAHFDEVQYLFSMRVFEDFNIVQLQKDTSDYKVMEKMTELWVNFAKHGNPTPVKTDLIKTDWLPLNNDKIFRTLNINEELKMENIVHLDDQLSLKSHAKNKL